MTCRLWNSATGQCLKVFLDHKRPVYALTFSPDGKWLGTGSGDGWLHIYSVKANFHFTLLPVLLLTYIDFADIQEKMVLVCWDRQTGCLRNLMATVSDLQPHWIVPWASSSRRNRPDQSRSSQGRFIRRTPPSFVVPRTNSFMNLLLWCIPTLCTLRSSARFPYFWEI